MRAERSRHCKERHGVVRRSSRLNQQSALNLQQTSPASLWYIKNELSINAQHTLQHRCCLLLCLQVASGIPFTTACFQLPLGTCVHHAQLFFLRNTAELSIMMRYSASLSTIGPLLSRYGLSALAPLCTHRHPVQSDLAYVP